MKAALRQVQRNTGVDGIPCWIYRKFATQHSTPIHQILQYIEPAEKLLVAEKTKFFATIEENEETYQDYLVKLNVKRLGGIMQYNIDKDI